MRIAIIGQKGIPACASGVERHVEEVAVRMARQGHEVIAYVRNSYAEKSLSEYRGVRLIHLPSIPTKHLDAISHTLLATVHALFQSYDIIHFHSIGPATLCWIIRLLKRRSCLIATFHSRDYFHGKWGLAARLFLRLGEYLICTVPHATVVLTRGQQSYVRETYGTDTEVIPNGYAIRPDSGTGELASWGLTPKHYILSVCRLIPHKGIHYLLNAFMQLEDVGRLPAGMRLVIVGSGFHTDDYERYLHDLARGRSSIVFTGTQSGKALAQLYSHACIFVQPSDSEGLSIALLEAMGCGIAPLVSSIPENIEPLQGLGFTFEAGNVGDLKNKLAAIMDRDEEIADMGRKVWELAEREYNWDGISERYLRLYGKCLAGIGPCVPEKTA
jgi:glycosyltransferase involved in cell wall biosynthesis